MPVTDTQANAICSAVDTFTWRDILDNFDAVVAASVDGLQNKGMLNDIAPWEIGTVSAACVLGPSEPGTPDESIRRQLLSVAYGHLDPPDTETQRIPELVVAFGCGAFRQEPVDQQGWDGIWPDAISAIASKLERAVSEVNHWLDAILDFQDAGLSRTAEDHRADALQLAMWLVHPVSPLLITADSPLEFRCAPHGIEVKQANTDQLHTVRPGTNCTLTWRAEATLQLQDARTLSIGAGRPVRLSPGDGDGRLWELNDNGTWRELARLHEGQELSVSESTGPSVWQCGCGHKDCALRHRMRSWDPALCSLWSFLASAAKGPRRDLQGKSYFVGMLASLYASVGFSNGARIRLEEVEIKKCAANHGDQPVFYEGQQCPRCGRAFDPRSTFVFSKPKLILVGLDPSKYTREPRVKCTVAECGNLFVPDSTSVRRCNSPTCRKPFLSSRQEFWLFKLRKAKEVYAHLRAIVWLRNRNWDADDRNRHFLEHVGVMFANVPPLRPECNVCGTPVGRISLCPLCKAEDREDGCLPQRPVFVWVRKSRGRLLEGAVVISRSDDGSGGPEEIVVIDRNTSHDFYRDLDERLRTVGAVDAVASGGPS